VQFLHRIPRPRRIIQRANLGVDQFNRDPVPLYTPPEKIVSHWHSRSN
jgi:hypothetical protein